MILIRAMQRISYKSFLPLYILLIGLLISFKETIEYFTYGFPYKTAMRLNLPTDESPNNGQQNIIMFSGPDILNEWKRNKKIFRGSAENTD